MAIRFNAHADRLEVSGAPAWGCTIGMHVRLATDRNNISALAVFQNAANAYNAWALDSDGVTMQCFGSTTGGVMWGGPPALTVGEYAYITITINASRQPLIYRVPPGSGQTATVSNTGNALTDFVADIIRFAGFTETANYLDADIASIKVWDVVQTRAQIEAEAAQHAPVLETNVWAWYRFDGTAGQFNDRSANARNLTNTGGAGAWETATDPAGVAEGVGPAPIAITGALSAGEPSLAGTGTVAQGDPVGNADFTISFGVEAVGEAAAPTVSAIRFGANANGVDGLESSAPVPQDLHTIMLWIRKRVSTASRQMSPLSLENAEANQPPQVAQMLLTGFQAETIVLTDTNQGGFQASLDLTVGEWYCCAVTHSLANARTNFYVRHIDDADWQVFNRWNAHADMPSIARMLIGTNDADNQNSYWDGDIAGVKAWNREFTDAAALLEESQSLAPTDTTNLWAYYPLQSLDTMLQDASGNGRNLTARSASGTWTVVSDGPALTADTGGGPVTEHTGTITATVDFPISAAGTTPVAAVTNVRMLCLGDSITEWNSGSYRRNLRNGLISLGFNVTMVGAVTDNVGLQHEGHGGYTVSGLYNLLSQSYMDTYTPNVVTTMAGINNFSWTPRTAADEFDGVHEPGFDLWGMTDLWDRIFALRPGVRIVALTIFQADEFIVPPNGQSRVAMVDEWNATMRAEVTRRKGLGQNIDLIDTRTFLNERPAVDGLHPSQTQLDSVGTQMVQPMAAILGAATAPAAPTEGTADFTISFTVQAAERPSARGVIPAILPERLTIGLFEDHDASYWDTGINDWRPDHWMADSGRPWDIKYRYLAGPYENPNSSTGVESHGWANNWGWGGPWDGSYARAHMDEAAAQGFLPAFSYYALVGVAGPPGSPSSFANGGDGTRGLHNWEADGIYKMRDPATMAEYFTNVRFFMQHAAAFGQPVFMLIEPDLLGFLDQHQAETPYEYAAVADSGLPELAGMPNTVAGWSQAFLRLKQATGASNVILGIHVSGWATGTDLFIGSGVNADLSTHVESHYNFLAPCGILPNTTGLTYDVLVGDPLDRDADFYLIGGNGDRPGGENRWWSTDDGAAINSQSFNRYREWLRLWNERSGLRWVLWQIPHGTDAQENYNNNEMQAYGQRNNRIPGAGYRDNRPEYFFDAALGEARRQRFIDAGVISLMFGPGISTQASHLTDFNFIRDNAVFGQAVGRGTYTAPTPVPGYEAGEPGTSYGSVTLAVDFSVAAAGTATQPPLEAISGTVSSTLDFTITSVGFSGEATATVDASVAFTVFARGNNGTTEAGTLYSPVQFTRGALRQVDTGFDILTLPNLDATFTPRRDFLVLADAFARRLITPRGALWSDPEYGFDVRDFLNDEITPTTLAVVRTGIEAQAEQDERFSGANVSVSYSYDTETLWIRSAILTGSGPFSFVMGVKALSSDFFLSVEA